MFQNCMVVIVVKFTWGKKKKSRGFLGGSVVKNPPTNAGNMSLIPDLGRSHVPWSN